MYKSICIATAVAVLAASTSAWAQKTTRLSVQGPERATTGGRRRAMPGLGETGYRHRSTAVAAAPPPKTGPKGERLRGAARGAVAADVVGGDAGRGAAAGAVVGGARARRNQAAQAQQAQASKAQTIDTYYRAYGACMQGRGYTVK